MVPTYLQFQMSQTNEVNFASPYIKISNPQILKIRVKTDSDIRAVFEFSNDGKNLSDNIVRVIPADVVMEEMFSVKHNYMRFRVLSRNKNANLGFKVSDRNGNVNRLLTSSLGNVQLSDDPVVITCSTNLKIYDKTVTLGLRRINDDGIGSMYSDYTTNSSRSSNSGHSDYATTNSSSDSSYSDNLCGCDHGCSKCGLGLYRPKTPPREERKYHESGNGMGFYYYEETGDY